MAGGQVESYIRLLRERHNLLVGELCPGSGKHLLLDSSSDIFPPVIIAYMLNELVIKRRVHLGSHQGELCIFQIEGFRQPHGIPSPLLCLTRVADDEEPERLDSRLRSWACGVPPPARGGDPSFSYIKF